MSMTAEQVEALLPDFQYVDGNRIVMTVGFAASFCFWQGHTAAKRQAIVECVEAYEAAYGDHLTWGCDPDSWETRWLADKKIPRFRDYVRTLDEDDAIEWYVASGDEDEAANEYALACLTERGWMEGRMSSLTFQVPRALAFDITEQKTLSDLIHFCHNRLQPFHGQAGFCTVTTEQGATWEPEELDVATRYMALYVGAEFDRAQGKNGIKGINWLTFVSDVLCERIGGPQAFEANCARFNVTPLRHGSGYIVRAGNLPELGPATAPPPEAYVKANAALRPLRNGNFGSMGSGSVNGELHFDRCTSDLWIRRFDAPGIWPPASFIGLGKQPLGTPPSKRIKLKTGDTCAVHGRYRDPADIPDDEDAPSVVLLPGDVAPYRLRLGPHGEYLGRDAVTWELWKAL